MVTKVGMQLSFIEAVKDLIQLDYDAVEAYDAAINRLDNKDYIANLSLFKADHERHIREFSTLLRDHAQVAPTGPSVGKQWLTKGKVVLANLVGDHTILRAMKSNEIDTNTAYERMCEREDVFSDAKDMLQRGLEDERRHKAWLESILSGSAVV